MRQSTRPLCHQTAQFWPNVPQLLRLQADLYVSLVYCGQCPSLLGEVDLHQTLPVRPVSMLLHMCINPKDAAH